MGARHVGDVALLCAVARPDIVGRDERRGRAPRDVRVVGARSWRPRRSRSRRWRPTAWRSCNADDPVVAGLRRADRGSRRDVRSRGGRRRSRRGRRARERTAGRRSRWSSGGRARAGRRCAVPGEHMVSNALAAAAVGVDARRLARGVRRGARHDAVVSRWRMETFTTRRGRAGRQRRLQREPRVDGRRAAGRAVDGGGGAADRRARHHGRARTRSPRGSTSGSASSRHGCRVDRLIAVGARPARSRTRRSARASSPRTSRRYDDPDERSPTCGRSRAPGDVVLFKGSRVAGLERDGGGAAVNLDPGRRRRSRSPSRCSARRSRSRRSACGDGASGSARTVRTPTWRRWARRRWAAS